MSRTAEMHELHELQGTIESSTLTKGEQARCTCLPGNPPRKPDDLLAKSHEDLRNPTEYRASTDSSSTSRAIPQCSRGKEQRITAQKFFVKLLTQKRAESGVIARESCGRDGLETPGYQWCSSRPYWLGL
ncbi:unnamed protein product [Fusarium fujikuroi]|uniref:Uncharacterized protein n=1 Tax=Fusarium fujikuroi TaxID=5127 RepID=A0A2H3S3W1_FUSFU|nr:uncharacterized protein FFC1_11410 [Fusarium fujikuroi]SCO13703.1 uncharacterized protein FFE2_12920 [Fusarium fujikuroi]SCV57867.1 uncharacterized protein FFFS_12929 [Fusarium fujikuroi]VTT56588.1 unnamed protein product [Fusarium fujikuroi]VTT72609.1 unnamed protein product [Fusarium fujikuroi]